MSKPTISACVIMHDDYDALQEALSSVIDIVDEIVVVDGAYEWIAPFLEAVGRDPSRSEDDALRIVEGMRAVKPVVYVCGVWRNELEKRIAAYERCSGDFVYLIDSDEIHAFDHDAFERFASSGTAVAMAASPLYADAGHVGVEPGREADPLKPVLFRRADIAARNHLAYLWLVLTPEERASLGPMERALMYLDAPIAVNHHLSNLRSLRTSRNRAAFYCLLANRSLGRMSWWGHEEVSPEMVTQTLLSRIESAAFYDMLRGHNIAMGFDPATKATFAPFPADARTKALIGQVADRQRQEFRHDREMLASAGRHVLPGQATFIDVTDWGDAVAEIEADAPVQALRITQYDFRSGDGGLGASETVAVQAAGHTLPIRAREDGVFRRVVGIHAWWPVERGYVSKLRVRSR